MNINQLAALGLLFSGYGGRLGRGEDLFATRRTKEPTPEEEARRAKHRADMRERSAKRAERIAARKAIMNPHYATEPLREEFPSRQAFREAHRKWNRQCKPMKLRKNSMTR